MARRAKNRNKSNGPILLIIGGGVLLLLIAGCAVGGYFAFRSAKQVVAEASGNARGAAQNDGASAAEAFLKLVSTEPIQVAYETTSPSYRASTPILIYYNVIDSQPLFVFHTSRKVTNAGTIGGTAPNRKQVFVYELSKPGSKPATVTLTVAEQPGGGWKVDKIASP